LRSLGAKVDTKKTSQKLWNVLERFGMKSLFFLEKSVVIGYFFNGNL